MFQIQRRLSCLIEGVHRDDTKVAMLANENSSGRPIESVRRMNDGTNSSSGVPRENGEVNRWGIKPSAAGSVEKPASVMIRSPTPGLKAGKGPAEAGIPNPLAHGERRPAEACAEGPPTIAKTAAGKPGAIGVEIGVARKVVGRACVLQGSVGGIRDGVDAARNPVIKLIVSRNPAKSKGVFTSFHGE